GSRPTGRDGRSPTGESKATDGSCGRDGLPAGYRLVAPGILGDRATARRAGGTRGRPGHRTAAGTIHRLVTRGLPARVRSGGRPRAGTAGVLHVKTPRTVGCARFR